MDFHNNFIKTSLLPFHKNVFLLNGSFPFESGSGDWTKVAPSGSAPVLGAPERKNGRTGDRGLSEVVGAIVYLCLSMFIYVYLCLSGFVKVHDG